MGLLLGGDDGSMASTFDFLILEITTCIQEPLFVRDFNLHSFPPVFAPLVSPESCRLHPIFELLVNSHSCRHYYEPNPMGSGNGADMGIVFRRGDHLDFALGKSEEVPCQARKIIIEDLFICNLCSVTGL